MAFGSPLTLDGVDGTDFVYVRRSSDANGSNYIDQATNLTAPGTLAIRHSTSGKGPDVTDRHLVQVTKVVVDSSGKQVTGTVNLTVAVPRNTAVTPTIVKHMLANIVDLLTDGAITGITATTNIDALLRGES